MSEILISVFAVFGIIFLMFYLYDLFILPKTFFSITLDLETKTADEIENAIDRIMNVRKIKSGELLTSDITVLYNSKFQNSETIKQMFETNGITISLKDTYK